MAEVLLRDIEDALMPRRCVFCGEPSAERERFICRGCDEDLPRIEPMPVASSSPLERLVAPLAYEFPVDAAIKAYKFRRRLYYAPAFADIACEECRDLPDDIDGVLPVPLHWRRQWFRGFNQAREIGRPLARQLGVPLIERVYRRRATSFQSGLAVRDRARNLRAAFAVRGVLPYRHVLIVDDVVTTGATIEELARTVLRHGVDRISALALARARPSPLR